MQILPRRRIGAASLALALLGCAAPALSQVIGPSDRPRQTLAAPLSESYPAEAIGHGVTTGGYNQSRWAEVWRAPREAAQRKDVLDRLKYLPLTPDGLVYLTLSGELRLRMNVTTNPDLRESEAQRQDIARIVGGADLHIGEHLRVYGELAHGGISGANIGVPSGNLRNTLVVQQSFADLTGRLANTDVGLRYGRQTFADGPNLLTVPRDNNTIFLTFNGIRGWARTRSVRIDLFDFTVTRNTQGGTGDDLNSDGRRFTGISTGIVLPTHLFGTSKLYLDPFVWRLRNRAAIWGGRSAREERQFYGVHVWGDIGPVNLDWTVNHQAGHFDGRPISAWQAFVAQSYRLGKGRAAPRIGVHADYGSGGGSYGKGRLNAALAPFGNNVYYSYQLYATPTNLIAAAPNLSVQLLPKVRAAIEYQFSWRDSVKDAVYRANGSAFAGTQNVRARKIGETARAQLVWTITPRLSFTGRYEHLQAGGALTQAGFRSSDFVAGWASFRF
ncbi:alginate export family protein [Sphingomonas morindae]|uniref:Alginate export family protein n=1 Tax=Sphingomonas morindae TaxID=1541170 RepID=A0ABY4XEC4_9SPHN|nr:alginate export family protein [Sphingomonas morindae]USI75050.1 alginate export family protein [Sphingomonas morindae]